MPTIRLVELHPIIVHFPIALLIVGVLLDFLALHPILSESSHACGG
jgi:uncharacterized membrane protein